MDMLRQALNKGQAMDEQFETLHSQQFYDWFHEYIRDINVGYKF
jgi:hypothetical protein